MRLTYAQEALLELEEIADYIATDNPRRACAFVQELRKQCRRIAQNPLGYPPRREIGEDVRSCAYGRYVVFFTVAKTHVDIMHILHGARDLSAFFGLDN
jgi:toxin ParE1/3/4